MRAVESRGSSEHRGVTVSSKRQAPLPRVVAALTSAILATNGAIAITALDATVAPNIDSASAAVRCSVATNGSFESPNIQNPANPTPSDAYVNGYNQWRTSQATISGWQTIAGTIDILRYFNNARDGAQSIDMWGTAPATIQQTFSGLVPGIQYSFAIDYSGLQAANSRGTVQLSQGGAFSTLATLTPTANAVNSGVAGTPQAPQFAVTWSTFEHTFTATGTAATVRIQNQVAPATLNTGLFIDNFRFSGSAPCEDFGDAPDSYGTSVATNGPAHLATGPMLGAQRDAEEDATLNPGANGDDITGIDDEGGVQFNTDVSLPGRLETVFVTASAAGYLNAWIDYNRNGAFDAAERVFADQPLSAGRTTLRYNVPGDTDIVPGDSYARFRITSATGQATTPIGPAPDGEVEDYTRSLVDAPALVLQQCPAGSVPVPVSIIQNPSFESRTGNFSNSGAANTINFAENWFDRHTTGGQYYVMNPPTFDSGPAEATMPTRAGADGYGFLGGHTALPDAGEGATNTLAQPLITGATYVGYFSQAAGGHSRDGDGYWQMFGTSNVNTGTLPQAGVVTPTTANTELLHSTPVVEYPGDGALSTWDLTTFTLVPTQPWDFLRLEARNATPANNGTVAGQTWMKMDDFHLFLCDPMRDFGDAPDGYDTVLNGGGPYHSVVGYDDATGTAPLMLGTTIDIEDDAVPAADAATDGSEDGVATPIVFHTSDATTTVTVTATNNTAEPATLAGWVDLDGDGAFEPGERITFAVPANSGSADYALVFLAATATTDTYARFRLYTGVVANPIPNQGAGAGEVEDYLVQVVETALEIEKSVDNPDARPGDVVTYTITATNTGTGDFTAENPAVVIDDLSGVLDDATFTSAISDVGEDPVFDSPRLTWSGALGSGDTMTLIYSATIIPGGDGVVENIAFQPPCDPEDPACDPVTPECVGGVDPATGLPCDTVETLLPRLTVDKSASILELPAVGDPLTYTVVVTNVGPGDYTVANPATATDDLSDVLDDATFVPASLTTTVGDASFAGSTVTWSGVLTAGQSATITYTVTYTGDGDLVLVNNVCVPEGQHAPGEAACDTVSVPGPALSQSKSVDPADGTSVIAGQAVTYTLRFENDGPADAAVDTFDDLTDVLDDATLTAGPNSSDPSLTATLNGTSIDVVGAVPSGSVVTVTYTVTVNAFAAQGDHILGNVLMCAPADPECVESVTENPIRHLTVVKSADPATGVDPGDTVTYTVTVTNDGEGDYTAANPAEIIDDLSGVIDDARYNDDADAGVGTVTYTEPTLNWSEPLAAGESVTITYTVLVTNAGDHNLRNTAGEVCASPVICDPPASVETLLPHVVTSKSSSPASGQGVDAGDVITYTLSWTNDGLAPGVVDATDNLIDVLDDATITTPPTSSDPSVTATAGADSIRVLGPIGVGATVTVSYQVTILPDGERGNDVARNVLAADTPPELVCDEAGDCVPPPDPFVEHPIGELDDWKTVDPASGTNVQPGQVVTYTLHFENTGEADVTVNEDDVLTAVLDDATLTGPAVSSDVALTVSALVGDRITVTGTLVPDQVATVTYSVTVNPDGQRGDDQLGNAIVDAGEDPPVECEPTDPARPDCTVNYVSSVVVSKSANPESGTALRDGQRVVYTLTFENVSTNPSAPAAPIDYTDHMAGVLDDATLSSEPTPSTDALTATASGDTIVVIGSLAPGDMVTVVYTVTVKAYTQQGDHALGNVVAVTGVAPICAVDSPLCTLHPTAPPTMIAFTGSTIAWSAALAALILLLAGSGAVLIGRRRVS